MANIPDDLCFLLFIWEAKFTYDGKPAIVRQVRALQGRGYAQIILNGPFNLKTSVSILIK